jgi:hypothetical protein
MAEMNEAVQAAACLQQTGGSAPVMLTVSELRKLCEDAADNAIAKHSKAAARQNEARNKGLRYNVKVLLENYIRFKSFIAESVVSLEDAEKHENEALDEEALRIFGINQGSVKITSLQKSVATMAVIMAHVDRMLAVYRESCKGSPSVVVQRRWQVIERMYLREKRMTTNQIADEFHLEPRNIREDAKMAREDLKVLFFGIEAIVTDLT